MTVPSWAFAFQGKEWWEHHLCCKLLNLPAKNLTVSSDLLGVISGNIISVYMDRWERVVVLEMDEF